MTLAAYQRGARRPSGGYGPGGPIGPGPIGPGGSGPGAAASWPDRGGVLRGAGAAGARRRPRRLPGLPRLPGLARGAVAAALVLAVLSLGLSRSPGPVVAACLSFVALAVLLWREDVPPILFLPVMFQWSEVATWPLATLWNGQTLAERSVHGADLDAAATFGCAGVFALGLGMWLGAGLWRRADLARRLAADARAVSLARALRLGLGLLAVGTVLAAATAFAGPARETVGQISNVKYVGLFVIAYRVLLTGEGGAILAALMAFEIGLGMTSFFAEFKDAVLTLLVAAMAARPRLSGGDVARVAAAVACLVAVAVFWTAAKPSYRAYLNKGTGAQAVLVPLPDRLGYLLDAALEMDGPSFAAGFDALIARHGYLEYLALTLSNVPAVRPHEDGALTAAVARHVLMPRILFPEKAALENDTEIMARYTGLPFLWRADTSISIGNLGEMYVDFGMFGALGVEFVLGLAVGAVARRLARAPPRRGRTGHPGALVDCGLMLMLVLPLAYFGTAYVKLVGGLVYASVLVLLLQRVVLPKVLALAATRSGPAAIRARSPSPVRRRRRWGR